MKSKLINDFFKADDIKHLIQTYKVDIDPGVEILNNLMQNIRDDIDTMDEDTKKQLDAKRKEINNITKERKEYLKARIQIEDDIDQRNLDRKILMQDFTRLKKEMLFIQNLAYKKGWFD